MKRRISRDIWSTGLLLVTGFVALSVPLAAQSASPGAPAPDLAGKIFGPDGRPAAGVEILSYHLATAELFTATSDDQGSFTLPSPPFGYFDLASRSSDGLYVADHVAHVSAQGKNFVELRLQPLDPAERSDLRTFAGAEEAPVGLALVTDPELTAPSFWRTPGGYSTIAGGGAMALALLTGGGTDRPASPFLP